MERMERMPEMRGGIRPTVDFHAQQQGQVEDRFHEAESEDAIKVLVEILKNRPELRQYVTQDTAANAAGIIRNLRTILQRYPTLLAELAQAASKPGRKQGEIVMVIIPNLPLVLTQSSEGFIAFAPALTCTLNALTDVSRSILSPKGYSLVSSSNGLIPHVLRRLETDVRPVISYDRTSTNPLDYIALGATGIFYNETFRVTLPRPRNR